MEIELSESDIVLPCRHWHPSPAAQTLVTGGTDGVARLWDAASGSERCSVLTREGEQVSHATSLTRADTS